MAAGWVRAWSEFVPHRVKILSRDEGAKSRIDFDGTAGLLAF